MVLVVPSRGLRFEELLPRCVEAVDQYLDMDAAMAVAAEVSTPQYAREADWKRPRVVGSDGVFLQLLEAATRG